MTKKRKKTVRIIKKEPRAEITINTTEEFLAEYDDSWLRFDRLSNSDEVMATNFSDILLGPDELVELARWLLNAAGLDIQE